LNLGYIHTHTHHKHDKYVNPTFLTDEGDRTIYGFCQKQNGSCYRMRKKGQGAINQIQKKKE